MTAITTNPLAYFPHPAGAVRVTTIQVNGPPPTSAVAGRFLCSGATCLPINVRLIHPAADPFLVRFRTQNPLWHPPSSRQLNPG
jgi:hypothetical protein